MIKDRTNAITLATAEDFRRDSDLFGEGVHAPEAQSQMQAAMKHGFQTALDYLGRASRQCSALLSFPERE